MYRKILIALDGSKNAEKVLPWVVPVLKHCKAKAILLQVQHGADAAAKAYLRSLAKKLMTKKIQSTVEVAQGDAAVGILRAVEDFQADLVAFTSHGEGGLSQWVFGSVAQKVLRGCQRSLLVVRALQETKPPVKRILVPLDGSVVSEAVRPHMVALAQAYKAKVQLLYVAPAPGMEADDSKLRHWAEREKMRMGNRFGEIGREEKGLKFESLVEEGDPADRILARSEGDSHPGMIVMGSHGRTGFQRWVYGSVSEKVLQAARVPVLVARA